MIENLANMVHDPNIEETIENIEIEEVDLSDIELNEDDFGPEAEVKQDGRGKGDDE